MSKDSPRLAQAVAAIDAANALDPHTIDIEGKREPAGLVYGRRMSATLGRISPQASEHLRIAVRGQHIERWTSPRKAYVEGRVGYLKWRKDLQDFHARRLGEIMAAAGYGEDDIGRVGALVRKERLKSDAEAQTPLAALSRQVRYWTYRRASAQTVNRPLNPTKVEFGCSVTILRSDGRQQTYRIVGEDEADPSRGTISHVSPVARALIGKEVGEKLRVGKSDIELVAIT